MPLSVDLLATAAECDNLLKTLEGEKDDLDFRKIQLTRLRKTTTANATDLAADLQEVEGEITTQTALVASLPEGDRKEQAITDLDRAKVRKRTLVARQKTFGSVALVEREFELALTEAQLVEVNDAVTVVTTRKGALWGFVDYL